MPLYIPSKTAKDEMAEMNSCFLEFHMKNRSFTSKYAKNGSIYLFYAKTL
jgi:hypothetical protein